MIVRNITHINIKQFHWILQKIYLSNKIFDLKEIFERPKIFIDKIFDRISCMTYTQPKKPDGNV